MNIGNKENKLTLRGSLSRGTYPGMSLARTMRIITPQIIDYRHVPKKYDKDGKPTDKLDTGKAYYPFERFVKFDIKEDGDFEFTALASPHFNKFGTEGRDAHLALLDMQEGLEKACGVIEMDQEKFEQEAGEGALMVAFFSGIEIEVGR